MGESINAEPNSCRDWLQGLQDARNTFEVQMNLLKDESTAKYESFSAFPCKPSGGKHHLHDTQHGIVGIHILNFLQIPASIVERIVCHVDHK